MAKLIFLICILVALVHVNASEQSVESDTTECKFCVCVDEKKKLPALSTLPTSFSTEELASTLCQLESYAIINDNITVNEENLTRFLSNHTDQLFIQLVETIRNGAYAAVAGAQANNIIDDVYVEVLKPVMIKLESINKNKKDE